MISILKLKTSVLHYIIHYGSGVTYYNSFLVFTQHLNLIFAIS